VSDACVARPGHSTQVATYAKCHIVPRAAHKRMYLRMHDIRTHLFGLFMHGLDTQTYIVRRGVSQLSRAIFHAVAANWWNDYGL